MAVTAPTGRHARTTPRTRSLAVAHRDRTAPDGAPGAPVAALTVDLDAVDRVLRRAGRVAAVVVVLLALGHAATLVLPARLQAQQDWGLLSFLDLSNEKSVGTWVTSVLHLTCALLAAGGAVLARRTGSRWSRNWWLLAVVFAAMSLDEVAALHDRLVNPLQSALGTSGPLLYAWVVPGALVGIAFLAVQAGFLRHLGRETGLRLVLAGAVFAVAAVGLEMVEGVVDSAGGRDSAGYSLLVLVEETLEVAAVLWVAAILVRHLRGRLRAGAAGAVAGPVAAPAVAA